MQIGYKGNPCRMEFLSAQTRHLDKENSDNSDNSRIGHSSYAMFDHNITYILCNLMNYHKKLNRVYITNISERMYLFLSIIPESPRWLLSVGRDEDAIQVLQTISKRNQQPWPEQAEKLTVVKNKLHYFSLLCR